MWPKDANLLIFQDFSFKQSVVVQVKLVWKIGHQRNFWINLGFNTKKRIANVFPFLENTNAANYEVPLLTKEIHPFFQIVQATGRGGAKPGKSIPNLDSPNLNFRTKFHFSDWSNIKKKLKSNVLYKPSSKSYSSDSFNPYLEDNYSIHWQYKSGNFDLYEEAKKVSYFLTNYGEKLTLIIISLKSDVKSAYYKFGDIFHGEEQEIIEVKVVPKKRKRENFPESEESESEESESEESEENEQVMDFVKKVPSQFIVPIGMDIRVLNAKEVEQFLTQPNYQFLKHLIDDHVLIQTPSFDSVVQLFGSLNLKDN